jgi:hypothetical protein
MHLHPRRGMWVQSRFCRCRSWTVATVPSSPRIWTRTRPIAISLTVLTDGRRSHLQHRLGSPLPPDLFGPRDATVHLLDHALDRRAADGQTQPAVPLPRVIHPVSVVLNVPQRIHRHFRGSSSEQSRRHMSWWYS